ncbi:MAG: InlB B-repeat-containing protein [Lachnospiraceae bacterium]|nr:InlB B-repeat-containing protein [Lachnospiraceae bacterium]
MLKKGISRKILAFALCVLLIAGMAPESILAAEAGTAAQEQSGAENVLSEEGAVGETVSDNKNAPETGEDVEKPQEPSDNKNEEPSPEPDSPAETVSEDIIPEETVSENEPEETVSGDDIGEVISEDEIPEAVSENEAEEPAGASIDLKLGKVQLPNSNYPNIYVKKDTTNGVAYVAIENLNATINDNTAGLICNSDLVLIVKGDNKIQINKSSGTTSYGIDVTGTLTIVGDSSGGKLRVDAYTAEGMSTGIRAESLIMTSTTASYSGLKNAASPVVTKNYSGCSSGSVEIEAYGGKATGTNATPSDGSYGIYLKNLAKDSSIMAGSIKAFAGIADSISAGIKMGNAVIGGNANVETSYCGDVMGTVRDGYGIGAGIIIGEIRGTNQGGNASSNTLTIKDSATVKAKGAPVYRGTSNGASRSYGVVGHELIMQGGTLEATGSTVHLKNANSEVGAGESFGIWCRNYNQTGGVVTAKSGTADTGYAKYASSCGLYVYGNAGMSAGTLKATAGDAWNLSSGVFVYSDATLSNTASVTAKGGLAVCDQNLTQMGSYGMYVGSKLWAAGASKIDATAGRMIWRLQHPEDAGIYARYLTVAGNASLIGRGGEAKCEKGSFPSLDNPSAMLPDDTHGIEVLADLSMQGGTLTGVGGNVTTYSQTMSKDETADSYGIYVKGNASFSGGTVNATGGTTSYGHGNYGEDSYGIYSENTPTFSGATVNASGGQAGTKGSSAACKSYGLYNKNTGSMTLQYGEMTARGYTSAVRNPGTVTVTAPIIYASTDYSGTGYALQRTSTVSDSWKWVQITAEEAIVDITGWTYGDTAHSPSVYNIGKYPSGVTVNGYSYGKKSGKSYSSITGIPSEAGNYGVKATLSNGITSGWTPFSISPRNLSVVTITPGTQNVYNGSSQSVVISSVKYGSKTLTQGTDYTITSGGTATNVGNTTLTITGKGNYTGTKTGTWTLRKKTPTASDFNNCTNTTLTYNGNRKTVTKPSLKSGYSGAGAVTVYYSGKSPTSYTKSSTGPINAGTYNVTFDVAAGTNYNSASNLTCGTLTINKASGDPATVTSTATVKTNGTCNLKNNITGNAGTPSFEITGSSYGCTVNSSTGVFTAGTTSGTVTVRVTFGSSTNYSGGTKNISVTIVNKDTASVAVTQADTTYGTSLPAAVFDHTGWTSGPTVSYTGTTAAGAPYSSSSAPTQAGNYVITVTGEDANKMYSGSASFKINPKSIAGAAITFGAQDTYNGSSKAVKIMTVKDGSTTLAASDYEIISGGTAINVEDQSVVIEGKGNYTGIATSSAKWKLQKRTPVAGDFILQSSYSISYTGEAMAPYDIPELRGGMTGCGDITIYYTGFWGTSYNKSETPPTDAGSYKVTFDVAAGPNFNAATELTYGTISIGQIDYTGNKEVSSGGQVNKETTLDLTSYTNGGTLDSPTVTEGDTYLDSTPTVSGKNLIYKFNSETPKDSKAKVKVTVKDCRNYNNYDLTVTLTAEHVHTLDHVEEKAPDCTMNGNEEYWVCTIDGCGKLFKDSEGTQPAFEEDIIKPALGHDWGEWKVTKEASHTEPGEEARECKREGCHEKETREIPMVPYTVTFSLNGKPGAAPVSQNIINGGKAAKPADPTAEGFNFLGWFKDAAGEDYFDFNTPINASFTLFAKWAAKEVKIYTVTFDMNGKSGTAPAAQKVAEGGMAGSPQNPVSEGFVFKGWYTDKECKSLYDFADPVTADITLYARWEEDVPPGAFKIFYTQSALAFDSYKGLTYNTENEHYEWTYTGSALKPAVTVTDHIGNVLSEGSDYTVKYSGNKDVSAKPAKVTVTGKGNYAGSKSLDFYILKADLGKAKAKKLLTVPDSFAVQKGKTIAATVIYRGSTIGSKDYKLSNTGKIKEDTTVDIEGIGNNFTGKISGIPVKALEAKEIREKTIKVELKADKHTYNGSAQELTDAELKVSAGNPGTPLSKGKDYRVIYGNNTDAGKAKVTVIALGDYVGTVSKTFTIDPDISSAVTVTLRDGTSAGFDPKGAKPALVVKTDKLTLTAGKDYKAAYSNNTAKGEGAYKLTFLGNFKGHKAYTGKFAITEAVFASASVNAPDLIYTKPDKYRSNPFVSIGGVMVDKKNYTVKYFDGTKELASKDKITLGDGETERIITIKATGRNNYKEEESAAFTYRVMKVSGNMINLSKAKIVGKDTTKAVKKQEYTGSAVAPEIDVLIKQGKEWVNVDPADYTVTYINNINKGKAVILVSGKGAAAAGSKTAKFTIKAKSMSRFN